jgi:hypothetical protein
MDLPPETTLPPETVATFAAAKSVVPQSRAVTLLEEKPNKYPVTDNVAERARSKVGNKNQKRDEDCRDDCRASSRDLMKQTWLRSQLCPQDHP